MPLPCFQIITASQTWDLRNLVLRPGLPLDTCKWPGDELDSTRHYGMALGDKIVAITSLYDRGHDIAPGPDAWQLRGMAVAPRYRGLGLGEAILLGAIRECRSTLSGERIWCNARSAVVAFYAKHGFEAVGAEFEIEGVGPHRRMVLEL